MTSYFCEYETDCLKYFASQLSDSEKIEVEKHIAECTLCCNTIAELTRHMSEEVSKEEQAFLDRTLNQSVEDISQITQSFLCVKK